MKIIVIFLIAIFLIIFLSKIEVRIYNIGTTYSIDGFLKISNILKIKTYSQKIEQNINVEELIYKIDFKKVKGYKEYKKIIKKVKFKIKKLWLKIEVGSKSIFQTVTLNTLLAINISILLAKIRNKIEDKSLYYVVAPNFNKKKSKVNVDCIIQVNSVHIIYIIYLLLKERRNQSGRTSNRKHNVICNE